MKTTKAERLMLYLLEVCYNHLNQPLEKSPVEINISKSTFIEMVLDTPIVIKHQRALYKNLEALEKKGRISYNNKLITFTPLGIKELKKIQAEIKPFIEIKHYFSTIRKPQKKLQTIIRQ